MCNRPCWSCPQSRWHSCGTVEKSCAPNRPHRLGILAGRLPHPAQDGSRPTLELCLGNIFRPCHTTRKSSQCSNPASARATEPRPRLWFSHPHSVDCAHHPFRKGTSWFLRRHNPSLETEAALRILWPLPPRSRRHLDSPRKPNRDYFRSHLHRYRPPTIQSSQGEFPLPLAERPSHRADPRLAK